MSSYPEALDSELLLDAQFDLNPPENIGATPLGARSIFVVTGGTFEGPRLRGKVRSGGDWYLALPNGAGELDVRLTLESDDGALIFVTYRGVLDATPDVMRRALSGEEVSPSEYYFRTTPRFETGSEKYAWLNRTVCVGVGRLVPGKVGYRIFAVK
jgi:Protein of unknown function (DUF3237)